MSSKWHKQSQFTEKTEPVVGYSLASHTSLLMPFTSLLMPFTGSTGPVVHVHGLTGLRKVSVKADVAICTYVLGVPGIARV